MGGPGIRISNSKSPGKDCLVLLRFKKRQSDWNLETHSKFGELGSTRSYRPVFCSHWRVSVCVSVTSVMLDPWQTHGL